MKMKVFKTVCAQGDVYIRRVNMEIPKNAIEVQPEGKYLVLSNSETGHDHCMVKEKVKMYNLPDSIMNCLLVVEEPTVLEHHRDFDTHEPILFEPGTYEIRRQREYEANGWRKVSD
jgi:hypothetical protein